MRFHFAIQFAFPLLIQGILISFTDWVFLFIFVFLATWSFGDKSKR